ncbi:MAG: HAMP domain-containing histidine kinase [Clostridia bacterium]|nr:HAMP domain-containing histidine kinase [Clostridia bacterium]
MLPWILCGIFAVIIIALAVKIRVMQKSMDEICDSISEHLCSDTNQLVTVSSSDKHVRHLASEIAKQLAELRRQRRQYISGDRELKEAVTNISHDLRTPLTAICGYMELLEAEELTAPAKHYVAQIGSRAEALKALTEELFRYSVISSVSDLQYEKVNVGRVLEDTLISFYGALEQKRIVPEITLSEGEIVRLLDPSALSRIFGNIIANAVKYSDGDFAVTMTEKGEITFSNTASALSSVEVGRLFDRFYTVDSARKSTGLGLSIAKLLTERMGGSVSAEYQSDVLTIRLSFAELENQKVAQSWKGSLWEAMSST